MQGVHVTEMHYYCYGITYILRMHVESATTIYIRIRRVDRDNVRGDRLLDSNQHMYYYCTEYFGCYVLRLHI